MINSDHLVSAVKKFENTAQPAASQCILAINNLIRRYECYPWTVMTWYGMSKVWNQDDILKIELSIYAGHRKRCFVITFLYNMVDCAARKGSPMNSDGLNYRVLTKILGTVVSLKQWQ